MIRPLTKKEVEFLQKLALLLKDYNVAILCGDPVPNAISFEVYDGHGENQRPLPIVLGDWVDEEDIYSLFRQPYEEFLLSRQAAAGV